MGRLKEIAEFVCGAEAFHAIVHTVLWLSDTTLIVFGIKEAPALHLAGAIVNALISLALGIYGWGPFRRHSTPAGHPERPAEQSSSS